MSSNSRESKPAAASEPHAPVGLHTGRRTVLRLGGAAMLIGVGAARAQSRPPSRRFPERPVTLVVPYPPGGATDVGGRLIAKKLQELWGQPVVVENRAGAAGMVGTAYVAHATGDGYTVLLGARSTLVLAPMVAKPTYDPVRDFKPITPAFDSLWGLVVRESLKVKDLAALVALAKSQPGNINFASHGVAAANQLATIHLMQMTNIRMTHIPYNGSTPAMTALRGGHVDVLFDSLTAILPQSKDGSLRILATSGAKRSPLTPDIPTVAEAGVPGFDLAGWFGFFVPSKTPDPLVDQLNTDIVQVLRGAELHQQLARVGLDAAPSTPAEFAARMRSDVVLWGNLIKAAGIQPQ